MRVQAWLIGVMLAGCGTLPSPTDAGPGCDGGVVLEDGGCKPAPRADVGCTSAGFWCETAATALECQSFVWQALPCRGPQGCAIDAGLVSCDMSGNLEGDRCASTAEGKGLCTPDGLGTLECRDGRLVKTNTCRSCTQSGGVITCMP